MRESMSDGKREREKERDKREREIERDKNVFK